MSEHLKPENPTATPDDPVQDPAVPPSKRSPLWTGLKGPNETGDYETYEFDPWKAGETKGLREGFYFAWNNMMDYAIGLFRTSDDPEMACRLRLKLDRISMDFHNMMRERSEEDSTQR